MLNKILMGILIVLSFVCYQGCKTEAQSGDYWLTWTAPGDDDTLGIASTYDIRYSLDSITLSNWDAAIQLVGEPAPSPYGTKDSFLVNSLLPNTTYYFCIRTADEVPNWSGLSNVHVYTTGDFILPSTINDLSGHE